MKINETATFEGEGETQDKNRLQKLEPAEIPSREEAPEKFQKLKFITKFGIVSTALIAVLCLSS